jgi:hypothetical protein
MNVLATYAVFDHIAGLLAEADNSRRAKEVQPRKPSLFARLVASLRGALGEDTTSLVPTLRDYPYA